MSRHPLLLPLFVVVHLAPAVAQCTANWLLPGEPLSTPSTTVQAMTAFDPDGAGPLPSTLYAGGEMYLESAAISAVCAFDGQRWETPGIWGAKVMAFAVFNGQLHAAVRSYNLPVTTSVVVLAPTGWQSLGTAFGEGFALATYNGRLIFGGNISTIAGVPVAGVAAWDGANWSPLGSGVQGTVRSLASFAGNLWVGGSLTAAGGVPIGNLAAWNGASWAAGPQFDASVDAMTVRSTASPATTYLFVGGAFSQFTLFGVPTFAQHLARIDAQSLSWTTVGTGVPGVGVTALAVRNQGFGYELVACTEEASTQRVWRYAGGSWSALGSLAVGSTAIPRALAYFAGRWTIGLTGAPAAVLAWDGAAWSPVTGQGFTGAVRALASRGGEVVVGGDFATASALPVGGLATGGLDDWSSVGGGVDGGAGPRALATASNGDLLVGGAFLTAGGMPAANLARWDGVAWTSPGGGLDGPVLAIQPLAGGEFVVGGGFTSAGGVPCPGVARWNGGSWASLGAGCDDVVRALALLPNGDIVAGGDFTSAGGQPAAHIARWDGVAWHALGSGCDAAVRALAVDVDGALFAGGSFASAGGLTTRIGRWSGGTWSAVDSTGLIATIEALLAHPNGDLFVGGGEFAWSGASSQWTSHLVRIVDAATVEPMPVYGGSVLALALHQGDLLVGGAFDRLGTFVSARYARFHTPCPAGSIAYGVACAAPSGPLVLGAVRTPWLGEPFSLRAAPFAPLAIGLQVFGFAPLALPLPSVLNEALPGCLLHATPDLVYAALPSQGEMQFGGVIPAAASLVGASLRVQALQFDLSTPSPTINSSNAVHLQVGAL